MSFYFVELCLGGLVARLPILDLLVEMLRFLQIARRRLEGKLLLRRLQFGLGVADFAEQRLPLLRKILRIAQGRHHTGDRHRRGRYRIRLGYGRRGWGSGLWAGGGQVHLAPAKGDGGFGIRIIRQTVAVEDYQAQARRRNGTCSRVKRTRKVAENFLEWGGR